MFICNTICQDYPGKSFQIQMGNQLRFLHRCVELGTRLNLDPTCSDVSFKMGCLGHIYTPWPHWHASCTCLFRLFCSFLELRPSGNKARNINLSDSALP